MIFYEGIKCVTVNSPELEGHVNLRVILRVLV